MVCGEEETIGMLSSDCRKTSALIVQQLASVRALHAALLFAHDQLGSALQLQYATALDARARQLRRAPLGDAQGEEQIEASSDQCLLATVLCAVLDEKIALLFTTIPSFLALTHQSTYGLCRLSLRFSRHCRPLMNPTSAASEPSQSSRYADA